MLRVVYFLIDDDKDTESLAFIIWRKNHINRGYIRKKNRYSDKARKLSAITNASKDRLFSIISKYHQKTLNYVNFGVGQELDIPQSYEYSAYFRNTHPNFFKEFPPNGYCISCRLISDVKIGEPCKLCKGVTI